MVCRREIPHVRLSARVVRFELAALDALIESHRVATNSAAGADS